MMRRDGGSEARTLQAMRDEWDRARIARDSVAWWGWTEQLGAAVMRAWLTGRWPKPHVPTVIVDWEALHGGAR